MFEQKPGQRHGPETANVYGIDYLELYVGNARHAAHFFRTAFGFRLAAYAGPETGAPDRISIVVEQGGIRLVLTSAVSREGPIVEHFNAHGDGVKDIALSTRDAAGTFEYAVRNGAVPVLAPVRIEDADGEVVKATVATFGDTVHSFVQRDGYRGPFLPAFVPIRNPPRAVATGLSHVDHIAISVEPDQGNRWVEYYRKILGMKLSQEETIYSATSGMITRVVRNDADTTVFVIVEPAPGGLKSPLDEYLMYYAGAGVHHIAVGSRDIVDTVGALHANGVEFARTPDTYYEALGPRVGPITQSVTDLRDRNILVDRDEWGYLLQIFAKPSQPRPTYFFEIIQRAEARGFGNGNIKALYEAIEREQALRGNA
jgi:4-hydroxyphenylpyruvate dioxygenase